ncbi:MAG: terpene cyclase/mutase family protein [Myxococcales bacterium]|nr:terpene cyclase/mutase family protein [Myxococcales bacterium]
MSHAAAPHAPHDPRPHDLGRHPRLDDAIARAAGYLARAQGREDDPRWRDYTDAEGRKGSNVWAAAFIAAHVGEVAETRPLAASAARALLRHRRLSGGWGYDDALLEDCDSTAWVLLAARRARVHVDRRLLIRALRFILEHQQGCGGFVTYGPEGAALFGQIPQRDGWFTPQTCVSAAALAALAIYTPAELPARERAATYLEGQIDSAGLWRPYWWCGFTYATYHATWGLRAAGRLDSERAETTARAALRERCPGGWAGATPGRVNGFATALACLTLCEVIDRCSSATRDRATAVLREAIVTLLAEQRPDGGFYASAELLVPGGTEGDTMTMLDRGPFTTAVIVHALDRARAVL